MRVATRLQIVLRQAAPALLTVFALSAAGAAARAQTQNLSSAANPFFGSVTAQPISSQTLRLSLDEAVRRGLENNLGLKEAEAGQKALHGERDEALQQFLPTITLSGDTGYFQHDLAALGFSPAVIAEFAPLFPGGKVPPGLSAITRDDLTMGQIHFSETLFSAPVFAGWKAAGAAEKSAYFTMMSAQGNVIQDVATTYLRCIADRSEVSDAQAQVAEAQVLFEHTHAEHQAGTVPGLDELRARVELGDQQQALIAAQNALQKDLILLKREIGVDPGQKIELTDRSPYEKLAVESHAELLATAYVDRQDYQNLKSQAVEYKAVHAAYRAERLPSLTFTSYYGTSTVNGAGTHGDFVAMGTLKIPIFREARLRGDEDASQAQMEAVNAQLADLRVQIDEQVRAAMLDVSATDKLVDVARSNVELAKRALSDEIDRVDAGVDDNLPLVTAQATLATAESGLVESLYQYNVAKLALARSIGVIQTEYRTYLGR
jgi:outer membrane protein TolC